jgi:hypothetical protein
LLFTIRILSFHLLFLSFFLTSFSFKERALQTVISEKRAELDRYVAQSKSLEKILAEQTKLLEKMSNTGAGN